MRMTLGKVRGIPVRFLLGKSNLIKDHNALVTVISFAARS